MQRTSPTKPAVKAEECTERDVHLSPMECLKVALIEYPKWVLQGT